LETEQHLKHEFRKLGWNAPDPTLATAIGVKIDRLTSLPTLTCAASIVGCNSNSDRKETPTGPLMDRQVSAIVASASLAGQPDHRRPVIFLAALLGAPVLFLPSPIFFARIDRLFA
jgi:hypothetical protein